MALTCARCGAQNPDGNQFCQACGTQLTAAAAGPPAAAPTWAAPTAAAPAAPTATAPPLAFASPPGFASPYYSPVGAAQQAPVHRTPWVMIIAAVVGLVVIMAGCGTAIALLGNKVSVSGGITADVPSPTPAGSPSPIASPTGPQGPTASNDGETVPVPTGWAVVAKDNETITLSDPSGLGAMAVASAPSNPKESAQQQKASLDAELTSKYPDTKNCPNSKTTTGAISGVQGIFWELCFTLVSGAHSLPAEASLFVGTNGDGSAFYGVVLLTAQSNMQNLINESAPVLKGIQWKLK
jgi:zinc-ribbon domain